MTEDFHQWVIEDNFAAAMPDLAKVGVTITKNVHPYEEAKIRILNGGHTCLAYLAALSGKTTFDEAMADSKLFEHFSSYQREEVLPALTLKLPFSKDEYLNQIIARFKNASIGDTVERICADGFLKFPIFIVPTLRGCFDQNITPHYGIKSVASWYVFARHMKAGNLAIEYAEPNWDNLKPLLAPGSIEKFTHSKLLWGDLPEIESEFPTLLANSIKKLEIKWPL